MTPLLWRCPVHQEDMEQCGLGCPWWQDQWLLTTHAMRNYWYMRKRGVLPRGLDKFGPRWRTVKRLQEQRAVA